MFKNEREFQTAVCDLATRNGWLVYCHPDSRKANVNSIPGFPDLVLAKPRRLILAETKMPKRPVSDDQLIWLTILSSLVLTEVFLWYPEDWPEIERVLGG